jgi:hypothetical protein
MRSSRETSFRPDFGGANFTAHSTDQAVLYDPLTPLFDQVTAKLASLMGRDDAPNAQGSSHIDGWYGYVDKDLRGQFATHYCGGPDATACSKRLWAALESAGNDLTVTQGPDPAAWRANATAERIHFAPGILGTSTRWTNRPTYQQILSFDGHR